MAATGRPRTSVSVRTRITATVALLVLAGLVVAGVVVATIESTRLDRQLAAATGQEFAQFRKLQRAGVDPTTGEPFPDVGSMVRLYLQRTVPDEDELLVGWWDGAVQVQSPAWDEVSGSTTLADTVRRLLPTNGSERIASPYGELEVSVQSVQQGVQPGREPGALVVVRFLDRARAGLHETMRTYAIVATLALFVVTGVAAWVSGRLLAPLRTLRETADDISETDLSRRLPVSGNDDITALTRTFNGVLDRLEAAFVGQREFLDDAGHELRTPLTVLRGHLELLDPDSRVEIAETRDLLLDETDRMSRLVGDLTLLAKSDRPDFLRVREVDLGTLTRDLATKAPSPSTSSSPTSSGSRRRCCSSPTTRSSTPGPATRSRSARRTTPASRGSGCATPVRACRPRTDGGSSNDSAAAPYLQVTRASASACRSSARSPARTGAP